MFCKKYQTLGGQLVSTCELLKDIINTININLTCVSKLNFKSYFNQRSTWYEIMLIQSVFNYINEQEMLFIICFYFSLNTKSKLLDYLHND